MRKIENLQQYLDSYKELSDLIDKSTDRDDMIIFDQLSKCRREMASIYPEYETKRLQNLKGKQL